MKAGRCALLAEAKRLPLRGVGGPVLLAASAHADGQAILIVPIGEVLVDNSEFRGARVPACNGAGIHFERGHLTLKRCVFFDHPMGLLAANFHDAEVSVSDSEWSCVPRQRWSPGAYQN